MGTPFKEIYSIFLSQVTSYSLRSLIELDEDNNVVDDEMLSKNLQPWLMKATTLFMNCRQDLNAHDTELEEFNATLTTTEKQILGHYMLIAYLNTHLLDENLLKQKLNSRDYRQYSEQGLIRAINDTKERLDMEAEKLLSRYSWNIRRLKEMFKNE